MKKIIMSLFLTLALFLTACGGGQEETKSGESKEADEKTIQILAPAYDTGYLKEEIDSGVKDFEAANPGVKVEIISAGWDELNSKIVQLYQAGQAPDIMMAGSRSLRQFAEMGIIENLDSYLEQEYLDTRIENVMESAKIDGKQYGIPFALSSRALYYRSDLIDTPPANWDELLETAKRVHEEKDIYGFAIPTDLTSGTDEILNFIYQGNGNIVDENGEFTINSEANIKTMEYLKGFKDVIPDPVSTARADQAALFKNGDLAMFISGPWEKEEMDKNMENTPYKVAVLPQGEKESVALVTDSYSVSSLSDNKELAVEFIKLMSKPERQRPVSESHGWFPVLKDEVEDERFKEDFMKPFAEVISQGIPEPKVPDWDKFNQSFTIAVQKILTEKAQPKEAMDTSQQECQK